MAKEDLEKLAFTVRNALADWHSSRAHGMLSKALADYDLVVVNEREERYRNNARGGFRNLESNEIIVPDRAHVEFVPAAQSHDREHGAWVHVRVWVSALSAGDHETNFADD